MIKQPCQENNPSSQSVIERCTDFSNSTQQKFHSGTETRISFPLSPQSTQSVKDPYMKFENKSLKSDLSCQRFENLEKNLFNLYSRYDKQGDGSGSQSSSQDSYTCRESKTILSPWSVYGSKTSSPSLNGDIFRQEQLSESPQFGMGLNVSLDKETLTNSGGYFLAENDFSKSSERKTVQLDKLDNSKIASCITLPGASVETESSPDPGRNLPGSRISNETLSEFKDKTKCANEENKRNISQIMNLLRKKPKQDCTEQNNLKRIPPNEEGCYKWQHGSSLNSRSVGEINVPTKDPVCLDRGEPIWSFTITVERQEKANENIRNKIESVEDKKELDGEILGTAQRNGNANITARLSTEKDSTEQASAKEQSISLEDCEESCVDEDLMGSFNLNFSPLSHVTDSEEENTIDDKEGKGETAAEYNRGGQGNEKYSEENDSSNCNGKSINCNIEKMEVGGSIHSQKLNTDKDCTSTKFSSKSSDKSLSRDIPIDTLIEVDSIQEKGKACLKDIALSHEKQTDKELNCLSKVDVLHDIDLEFVENMKENVSNSHTNSDTALKSSKRSTTLFNEDHDNAADNDMNEIISKAMSQQHGDRNVDPGNGRDTDVETETCGVDWKAFDISDNKTAMPCNDKRSNMIEPGENKVNANDADQKLAENNESQSSRTTSQDTMEFSCNTGILESESQNYFGIETCQLDKMAHSSSLSNGYTYSTKDNHIEVKTCNLQSENKSSRYFECQNTSMSNQNLGNREILHEMKTGDSLFADESDNSCVHSAEDHKEFTKVSQLHNKKTSLDMKHFTNPFRQGESMVR